MEVQLAPEHIASDVRQSAEGPHDEETQLRNKQKRKKPGAAVPSGSAGPAPRAPYWPLIFYSPAPRARKSSTRACCLEVVKKKIPPPAERQKSLAALSPLGR
jgi:hypothetical protein